MIARKRLTPRLARFHSIHAASLALLLFACQSEAPARPAVDAPPARGVPVAASARPATTARQVDTTQQLGPYTPQRTRDGLLRFAHEDLHDNPAAAAELLRRLDEGGSSELRIALVEALPRTGGPWSGQALARMADEPDVAVRRMWVAIMVRAEPDVAVRGMALGLGDDHAEVRKEAALVAASLPVAALAEGGFDMLLRDALGDGEAPVRAAAARSLGILGFGDTFDEIAPLLADANANVRLQALRALGRLDRAAARALPTIAALRDDADVKVARAAAQLLD